MELIKTNLTHLCAKDFLRRHQDVFWVDKCAVLEMRRGRKVVSSGLDLLDDQHIREVEEQGCRYLGILQLDQTLNIKVKVVTIPDGWHLIHETKLDKQTLILKRHDNQLAHS